MAMERKTAKMLSTSGLTDEGETLFRVSLWSTPDNFEIDPDDDGNGPTIPVKVHKGRLTLYGRIDRDAWKAYLLKDDPAPMPDIPMPTDNAETSKVLSAFMGSTGPRPESVPAPVKPVSTPLFSRAKAPGA